MMQDVMLAHKIIESGTENRYGCRIPLRTNWRIEEFDALLHEYHDKDILEWINYGFSISRSMLSPDPVPATSYHLGANIYPSCIDEYIENEVKLGATIGPFKAPPFCEYIEISPLSSRPK